MAWFGLKKWVRPKVMALFGLAGVYWIVWRGLSLRVYIVARLDWVCSFISFAW